MKEAVFILFVLFLLLGLTAIRYRKQIAGIIGFVNTLKDVKKSVTQGPRTIQPETTKSIPLVNCSKCGVWVPQNKARKVVDIFYCSDECLVKQAV